MIYRPNSSKVKNLKTKDYLGKARLIASSDKSNMFTGFSGSERRAIINVDTSKDDRPADSISYAASNLVRSDLTSRSVRQQSAPPINRNMFPPTPPPENDSQRAQPNQSRPVLVNAPPPLTARANSIRDGSGAGLPMSSRRAPPHRRPSEDPLSPKSGMANAPNPYADAEYPAPLNNNFERPRIGTTRTASEPRGPVSKYSTARPDRSYRGDREGPQSSRRLFMETTPARRDAGNPDDADDDEYPSELYDLYRTTAYSNPYSSGSKRSKAEDRPRPGQNRYDERDSGGSSLDDFEMLNDAGGAMSSRTREPSRSRGTSRSRRPVDIRTLRVKMHHGDDTRYLMVSTTVMYEEFMDRVIEKLGMKGRVKIRMRDEGDMITVGDRDDWDLAIQTCRREARKAGEEMARLEVSLRVECVPLFTNDANILGRYGFRMSKSVQDQSVYLIGCFFLCIQAIGVFVGLDRFLRRRHLSARRIGTSPLGLRYDVMGRFFLSRRKVMWDEEH